MADIILTSNELLAECDAQNGVLKVNSTSANVSTRLADGTRNLTITFNFTPLFIGPRTVRESEIPVGIGMLKSVVGSIVNGANPQCIAFGPTGGAVSLQVSSFNTLVIKVEHGTGSGVVPANTPTVPGSRTGRKPNRPVKKKKPVGKSARKAAPPAKKVAKKAGKKAPAKKRK